MWTFCTDNDTECTERFYDAKPAKNLAKKAKKTNFCAEAITACFCFSCNSWCSETMGKAGSKVLRETSVDGVQAQVKAATRHTHTSCANSCLYAYKHAQTHKHMQELNR